MSQPETAVVVGTGPGLGWHLAKRFARAGMAVAVAARDRDKLEGLLSEEPEGTIRAYQCDAAVAGDVQSLFQSIDRDLGGPDLVVSNAGGSSPPACWRRLRSSSSDAGGWAAYRGSWWAKQPLPGW